MRLWLDRLRARRPSTRSGSAFALLDLRTPVVMVPPLAQLCAGVKQSCIPIHIMTHIVSIVLRQAGRTGQGMRNEEAVGCAGGRRYGRGRRILGVRGE